MNLAQWRSKERRIINIEEHLRVRRIGLPPRPEDMSESELAWALFESYKELKEIGGLSPEEAHEQEIDFFQDKLRPSFPREPLEYRAVITRICEELKAMGIEPPEQVAVVPVVMPAQLVTVAETGPTPENIEAMEYEQPKEEILEAAPQEPVKATNETETAAVHTPEPDPFPFPGYGASRPAGEVSQALRHLITELRSKGEEN
jgi:hypothetical protein